MDTFEQLKAEIAGIGTTMTEISADIDALLAKIGEVPEVGLTKDQANELLAMLQTTSATAQNIAAKYNPPAPPLEGNPADQGGTETGGTDNSAPSN